ncbi:basic salivary proline-rich protein 3-like [Macrobrachium nipponense]|uniref:basic salivary proline-rich protein 3-like n=1 Tax=Macrobrachium nipponense TaxID=159736 RepID=UPI0030C7E393
MWRTLPCPSWDPRQACPACPGERGGHCSPVLGPVAGPARLSWDTSWTPPPVPGPEAGLARPSRDTWQTPPAHTGTQGRPRPFRHGHVSDTARLSRDPGQAWPAHPGTRDGRLPARPGTHGGPGPSCLGHVSDACPAVPGPATGLARLY